MLPGPRRLPACVAYSYLGTCYILITKAASQLRENVRGVITTSLDNLILPIIRVERNLVQGVQPMSSVVEIFIYAAIVPSKGAVRPKISLALSRETQTAEKRTYPAKNLGSSMNQPT